MRSPGPYYPHDTECWNCLQAFEEHCAASDGCPKPTGPDGQWTGFYRHIRFLNLEATPIPNPYREG